MGGCASSKDKDDGSRSLLPSAFSPLHADIRFKYLFLQKIGGGQYSTIRQASLKSLPSAIVAVKTITKKKISVQKETLDREIQALLRLDHPNVTRLYEVFEDEKYIHLVKEYCTGQNLLDSLAVRSRYSEAEAMKIVHKILLAVNHMHSCGVFHRDLKTENFLYVDTSPSAELKLTDFGISNKIYSVGEGSEQKVVLGSPEYMAPEVIHGYYGPMCDMWSVGVIMYALLTGLLPFTMPTAQETLERARTGTYTVTSDAWLRISTPAIDLIRHLLIVNPKGRLTASEALKHLWFEPNSGTLPVSLNILESFKSYNPRFKLLSEIYVVLAKCLHDNQIKENRDTFMALDKDRNGYLDYTEINQGLIEAGYSHSNEEIRSIIANSDITSKGRVGYSEFLAGTINYRTMVDEDMMRCVFAMFDIDNSGFVTEDNLMDAMIRLGKEVTQPEVRAMMQEVGAGTSGISYREFRSLVTQGSLQE